MADLEQASFDAFSRVIYRQAEMHTSSYRLLRE